MQVIVGPRQSGKTTELVERAKEQEASILVHSLERKHALEALYPELDMRDNTCKSRIYTYNDLERGNLRGTHPTDLMIDDMDMFINRCVREFTVVGMAVTGDAITLGEWS